LADKLKVLSLCFKNGWYRFLLKPILIASPSSLLVASRIENLKENFPTVYEITKEYGLTIVFLSVLTPVVITYIEELVNKKLNQFEELNDHFVLLKSLNLPVEKKSKRFIEELEKIKKNSTIKSDEIFLQITKPDEQIAEIVRSLHLFFVGLGKSDKNFSTALFRMKNGVAIESWCYFPQDAAPDSKLLNDSDSLASHTVKRKKMLIVENIEKEKKLDGSVVSKNCVLNDGSAICYPIKFAEEYPLVIRITEEGNFFKKDYQKLYKKVFENFQKRIQIEYALSEIKCHVEQQAIK
jgi:hypothetical protein